MDNQYNNQNPYQNQVQNTPQPIYKQNNSNQSSSNMAMSVMGLIASLVVRNISCFFLLISILGPAFNDVDDPPKTVFYGCIFNFRIGFSIELINFAMVLWWRLRQKNIIKGTKVGKTFSTVALVISLVCIILLIIGFFVSLIGVLSSDYLTMQL